MRKIYLLTLLFSVACGTAETSLPESDHDKMDGGAGAGGGSGSGGGYVDGGAAGAGMSGAGGAHAMEDGALHDASGQDVSNALLDANGQDGGVPRDASVGDARDAMSMEVPSDGGREGGSFACGMQTCAADEWCEYPCCGTLPACMPASNEGGVCSVGFGSCPLGDGATGCRSTCSVPSCTKSPPRVGCTLNGRTVRCTCA